MAKPVVTCGANQNKSYGGGPYTINLTVTATGSPTLYTWFMKDVPPGSTVNVGTNGNFVDGESNTQNPSFDITGTIEGAFVLECIASNAEGNSDPDSDTDGCQTIIYVLTEFADRKIPGDYQFSYGDDLNETLIAEINKTLDELNTPTDNTNLNATSSYHGLLKKLSGVSSQFMNGVGAWASTEIPHNIGGAQHLEDSISNINSKISDAVLDDQDSPRPADEIIETSGPTTLAIGAIADTQLMIRSTSTMIGVATAGIDETAIHDNVSGEINAISAFTSIEPTDILLTEIQSLSWQKKKALISNIIASCVILQNGFSIRADSVLSWDNGDRELTITPAVTSFEFWSGEIKYTKTEAESIVIPDVEELYYIYYDDAGVLQYTTTFGSTLILTYALVGIVYWDEDNGVAIAVGDERHGREMSGVVHEWAHSTFGTLYDSGLGLANIDADGSGDDASAARCSVIDGSIRDEDVPHLIVNGSPQTLSTVLEAPILHRLGVGGLWRALAPTTYAISSTGSGRAAYNFESGGTYSIAEVGNNDYTLSHLFATNDIFYPIIIVMGQATYANINAAREGAYTEINSLSLGALTGVFKEFKAIGSLIFQTTNGYLNAVQSRVRVTDLGENYVDFRFSNLGSPGSSASSTDHNGIANNGGVGSHAAITAFMSTHKSNHVLGGSDSIKLDDLSTPDDNTDLNATSSYHGLLQKLPGGTSTFLRADGSFAIVPVPEADSYAGHEGDEPPISPHVRSDEFNDGVFDVGGTYPWTWARAGAPASWAEEKGVVWMKDTNTGGTDNIADWHYASKVISAGAFTIETKIDVSPVSNYNSMGITIDDGGDANLDAIKIQYGATVEPWGVVNQWRVASSWTHEQNPRKTYDRIAYLKLSFDGATTVTFYESVNGIAWRTMGTHTIGYTPSRMGFFIHSNTAGGSGLELLCAFHYFRVS